MKNLYFEVNGSEIANFPFKNIPIRNMCLRKIFTQPDSTRKGKNYGRIVVTKLKIKVLTNFIENFAPLLESLTLDQVNFRNSQHFNEFFKDFGNLKNLELVCCELEDSAKLKNLNLPNLRSVSLESCPGSFFNALELGKKEM